MPIQIWLPSLHGGALQPERQRDLRRVHAAWRDDHVIWTVPGWCGPRAWSKDGLKVGCISGEALECFRILYVGDKGGIFDPAVFAFQKRNVEGLLEDWLSPRAIGAAPRDSEPLTFPCPVVAEGGVTYLPEAFRGGAESVFPFAKMNSSARRATAQWPEAPNGPAPISPAEESQVAAGDAALAKTLALDFVWSAPFDQLAPAIITSDDVFAQAQMKDVRLDALDSIDLAVEKARLSARDWLTEGRATTIHAWLQPIIASEGEDAAVIALQSRFNVDHESLAAAYADPKIREALVQPMQVRRALGVPGLMWALLLDDLADGPRRRMCESCGRPIEGRKNKRFCTKKDSLECFEEQMRRRQRKSRARRG
jgi:hypothetical protein